MAAILIVELTTASAAAAPPTPPFGPAIEDYAPYVAPTRCRPRPKAGLLAFRDLLLQAYPDTEWIGIERPCTGIPTSDHQEGRALDWARDATDPVERVEVEDLLSWLLAPDAFGNPHALLRRLGITYIIWDRQIWGTWSRNWEVYCVQRRRKCRDPETRTVLDPHVDHVHVSFGWPGARARTSFWNPALSFPAG